MAHRQSTDLQACIAKKSNVAHFEEKISWGDVLGIFADPDEASNRKSREEVWYAYVVKVKRSPSGRQILTDVDLQTR